MHFVYVEADGSIKMSKSQFERVARDAYQEGYEIGKKECKDTHDAIYDDGYKAGYNAALNNTISKHNFITPTITCTESPKTYLNNTEAAKTTSSAASDSINLTNKAQVATPAVEVEVKKDAPEAKKIKIQYPDDIFDLLNKLTKELGL
jgi:hypothetical protein